MLRRVADAARLLATHARGAVASLSEQWPRCPVEYIALGEGVATPLAAEARDEVRRAWNLPPDAIVFGVFGALTAEKRIPQILRAFRRTLARVPSARLVLAGPADPSIDVLAIAKELNISAAVLPLGSPDDAMFDLIVGSVDVSLNLRWPSAMETSGPWLRALAAGRPTVVIDLPHQTHVPALDPRTWRPLGDAGSGPAVTVAIDILDEDHSLALAMHRLATDHALRAQLGERAREYWRREHTVDRMVDDYVRAIDRACACPAPTRGALTGDPWRHTRELLAPFGPIECTLF
jgi:glycosyltransferase involved in cell wall biosynthesis